MFFEDVAKPKGTQCCKVPPPPAAATLPVTVEPFNPNETPFAFENTTESRFPLVVPAEKLTDAAPTAPTLAVTILPALVPNVTLFALLNPRVWNVKLPLDALAA